MRDDPDIALKLIFCGTSAFAIPALKAVVDSRHQLLAVVTKSDRIAGRGLKESPTAVKLFMDSYAPQIPVLLPSKLRDLTFQREVERLGSELFVVASFPIMPMALVKIPPLGCLNLHPSMLPKYRGAAPIHWTLLNGETITGVTTFFIGGKIDAGNILRQREVTVNPDDSYQTLHNHLAEKGAELLLESLDLVSKGDLKTVPQDESKATPAPKVSPEDMRIDWTEPAEKIRNRVRAFSPYPGAFTFIEGKRLKIVSCEIAGGQSLPPGKGVCGKKSMLVGTGSEANLRLLELQLEGKKCLPCEAFICGLRKNEVELE